MFGFMLILLWGFIQEPDLSTPEKAFDGIAPILFDHCPLVQPGEEDRILRPCLTEELLNRMSAIQRSNRPPPGASHIHVRHEISGRCEGEDGSVALEVLDIDTCNGRQERRPHRLVFERLEENWVLREQYVPRPECTTASPGFKLVKRDLTNFAGLDLYLAERPKSKTDLSSVTATAETFADMYSRRLTYRSEIICRNMELRLSLLNPYLTPHLRRERVKAWALETQAAKARSQRVPRLSVGRIEEDKVASNVVLGVDGESDWEAKFMLRLTAEDGQWLVDSILDTCLRSVGGKTCGRCNGSGWKER